MSTGVYETVSLERAVCGIHSAGFESIELSCVVGYVEHVIPEKMKEEDYRHLDRLLRDFDLKVNAISGHVDLIGTKSTIPGQESVLGTTRALELWKSRIDLGARLGAGVMNTSMGEPETESDFEAFYGSMRVLLRIIVVVGGLRLRWRLMAP
jgi:sugar phosphate isomerase/epimerase